MVYHELDDKPSEDKVCSEFRKLSPGGLGYHAPRGCTNIPFIFIFAVAWVLMIVLTVAAFSSGNLDRLLYGVDYLGNVCGHGKPEGVNAQAKASWPARKYLYYPITYNLQKKEFNVVDALKTGICVETCPTKPGELVWLYSEKMGSRWFWFNAFDNSEQFNRCIPNFLSYKCKGDDDNCKTQLNSSSTLFHSLVEAHDVVASGFAMFHRDWWIIATCSVIAVVICFLWVFALRRMVKPGLFITGFLAVVGLLVLTGFFVYQGTRDHDSNTRHAIYFAGAAVTGLTTLILLAVTAFLFKDLLVAADIIEEAAKIPISLPGMFIVPPLFVLIIVPLTVLAVFVAAEIYTSRGLDVNVPSQVIRANNTVSIDVQVKQLTVPGWHIWGQVYNVFIFLWTLGFVHAVSFSVLALCGVFWYWSRPGDDKEPDHGVLGAAYLTSRFHLGTLALGSLVIAVLQIARLAVRALEGRLQSVSSNSEGIRFCVCCAECCLACFERTLRFISKNAYVVMAMTGESFVPAAKHAVSLLTQNVFAVGAVTVLGEWVMVLGKLLIVSMVTAVSYGIATAAETKEKNEIFFILVAVAIVTYAISTVFLNVVGVCVDVVLLCYCYDLSEHNGQDKPYFFPSDLAKHVEGAYVADPASGEGEPLNTEGEYFSDERV